MREGLPVQNSAGAVWVHGARKAVLFSARFAEHPDQFSPLGRDPRSRQSSIKLSMLAKRECRSGFAFFDATMNAPAAPDANGGSRAAADRGEVQPFVINDITETIFRESCRTARAWPAATAVRVNVSSVQLKDPWLAPRIVAIVSSTGISTSRLVIEVSARALAEASEAALESLESLQKAGMRLALRDLEGQPTPPQAGRLTFDEIKFDSSLNSLLERPHEMEITIALAARRRLAR